MLINRHAGENVGVVLLRSDVGQEAGRRASMRPTAWIAVQPCENSQLISEGRKRRERRRHAEVRPLLNRRPVLHHDAVRDVNNGETPRGLRRLSRYRKCRNHSVEERQGKRDAHAAQHGAS